LSCTKDNSLNYIFAIMKTLIFITITSFLVCCQHHEKCYTYLYQNSYPNNDSCNNQYHNNRYSIRKFNFHNDKIINELYCLDEKFRITSYDRTIYMVRGNDLYRLDFNNKEVKYLTVENDECVFYPVVMLDTNNQPDTIYGINHIFMGKCKLKNSDGDSINALKFFVRESKFKNPDRSQVGESDYLRYYSPEFTLIMEDYIGILCEGQRTERLEINISLPEIDTDNLPVSTFSLY
jgi:hypothetical protein